VARPGQGKRSGYRTVIAYRAGGRAVFLFGFAKNATDNIGADELAHWQAISADLLRASDAAMDEAVKANELTEVHDE
jgi:hypothetical protein